MEDIKTERTERRDAIMELIATDPGAVADMLVAWETELSKVMPADYKDWWQNSRAEWPMVARMSIESLRKREQLAWDMLDEELRAQDLEMQRWARVFNGEAE